MIGEILNHGSITPRDPKIAAFFIAGAVDWICEYSPKGVLPAEEVALQFARTLTYGRARANHPPKRRGAALPGKAERTHGPDGASRLRKQE